MASVDREDSKEDSKKAPLYAVLGASGGIGTAVSRALSAQGAHVALAGRRIDVLSTLADELAGVPFEVDATKFDEVDDFLNEVANLPWTFRGVVNCVGSLLLKPAHLTSEKEFYEVVQTNLSSAFAAVRSGVKHLRRDGGSIVLMASAAASIGLPNHEAIAAAKAGIAGLTRSAAATYASKGVRINAVAPGLVRTPMTERITRSPNALEASTALHPLGRIGEPEEVAGLVCWLLTEESSWVTGQVWGMDGGLSALKARV